MKRLALVFGIIFILAGCAGFVPALAPNGRLLGIFATNEAHDVLYLATGALGLVMSLGTQGFARRYFRLVGVAYAILAVMGFLAGSQATLLGMAMNRADHVLDLVIAFVGLLLGFAWPDAPPGPAPA
jgi:hypothetical protein